MMPRLAGARIAVWTERRKKQPRAAPKDFIQTAPISSATTTTWMMSERLEKRSDIHPQIGPKRM